MHGQELRHINTGSDSEVLLNIFASALFASRVAALKLSDSKKMAPEPKELELVEAVRAVMSRCVGGYAVITMIVGWGIVAFRDPNGIRPLVYGRRKGDFGAYEYMAASESGALNALGFDTKQTGVFGDETRAVLKRWQAARGYPSSGYLNKNQHKALLSEVVAAPATASDNSQKAARRASAPAPSSAPPPPQRSSSPGDAAGAAFVGGVVGGMMGGMFRR